MKRLGRPFLATAAVLAVAWACQCPPRCLASGDAPFFCWIEGEDYTTATQGISIVLTDKAGLSQQERKDATYFLARSGRTESGATAVSGRGYMVRPLQGREPEHAQYDFTVPEDGSYFVWLRILKPPPCNTNLSLWFDSLDKRTAPEMGSFGFWGAWTWWGWGQKEKTAPPKAYALSAGHHRLFLGDMVPGVRFDKILITNDPRYVPVGISERFYTSTFSPPAWPGSVHGSSDQARASDTGWLPFPAEAWSVEKEALSDNYVYRVAPLTSVTLAYSLIQKFEPRAFEGEFLYFKSAAEAAEKRDGLLVFAWSNANNFDAVSLTERSVDYLQVRQGATGIVKSVPHSFPARAKSYNVRVKRSSGSLEASVDSAQVLTVRLPYPAAGAVGLATTSGGVAFDDAVMSPLEDPTVAFDFGEPADPALKDWVAVRNSQEAKWSASDKWAEGDQLLYSVPSWSNSAVSIPLGPDLHGGFSVLFPYTGPDRFMETKVTGDADGKIHFEVVRHLGGRLEKCGAFAGTVEDGNQTTGLSLQCIQGSFAAFLGGKRVLEANEYDLLEGTLGFLMHDTFEKLPVRNVTIEKRNLIVDNFPLAGAGGLDPMWKVAGGDWRVVPTLEGEAGESDGQLTVRGQGTALLGKETWRSSLLEVSALVTESSDFALLGWQTAEPDAAVELLVRPGEISLRKVAAGNPLVLAKAAAPALTAGWHRFGLALNEKGLIAELDGKECLHTDTPAGKGRAGLRNYGGLAVFDNLTVHILSEDRESKGDIQTVDPLLVDIENAILK